MIVVKYTSNPVLFEIEAPFLDPLIPIKIRFIPVRRTRQHPADCVKAVAVRLDGREVLATPSDISLVTDKQFFGDDPRWIGRERLILWLNGLLSDEEAASVGSAHEFEYLKWYQTENLE
jgi:hypothetical protein